MGRRRKDARRRRICDCGETAGYYSTARGRWQGDEEHTLCARCWRAALSSAIVSGMEPREPRECGDGDGDGDEEHMDAT